MRRSLNIYFDYINSLELSIVQNSELGETSAHSETLTFLFLFKESLEVMCNMARPVIGTTLPGDPVPNGKGLMWWWLDNISDDGAENNMNQEYLDANLVYYTGTADSVAFTIFYDPPV
jgi:hypothetical protein